MYSASLLRRETASLFIDTARAGSCTRERAAERAREEVAGAAGERDAEVRARAADVPADGLHLPRRRTENIHDAATMETGTSSSPTSTCRTREHTRTSRVLDEKGRRPSEGRRGNSEGAERPGPGRLILAVLVASSPSVEYPPSWRACARSLAEKLQVRRRGVRRRRRGARVGARHVRQVAPKPRSAQSGRARARPEEYTWRRRFTTAAHELHRLHRGHPRDGLWHHAGSGATPQSSRRSTTCISARSRVGDRARASARRSPRGTRAERRGVSDQSSDTIANGAKRGERDTGLQSRLDCRNDHGREAKPSLADLARERFATWPGAKDALGGVHG